MGSISPQHGSVHWKITMELHEGSLRRFVKLWIATTITLCLLFVLASLRWPPLSEILSSPWRPTTKQSGGNSHESKFAGLAELLPRVAMDDRTVIITSVNEAFARPGSLLDLFRESFVAGEGIHRFLDHILVVAVDAAAYRHCRSVHRFCYLLPAANTSMDLSSASDFMSDAYLELVWTKIELQQRVLQLGYNFLFTDVDIMWFRDPFRHIGVYADMATSCDVYTGDADDIRNWPNTGFFYVKATSRTVEMMRQWRAARPRFPRGHEQDIFNYIKHEITDADGDLHIRVQFLDTAHFSGFCQLFQNDMATACTMHANCCVGMANKISDLRDVLGQWRNYTVITPPERKKAKAAGRRFAWRVPAKCGTPDKRPEEQHKKKKTQG